MNGKPSTLNTATSTTSADTRASLRMNAMAWRTPSPAVVAAPSDTKGGRRIARSPAMTAM